MTHGKHGGARRHNPSPDERRALAELVDTLVHIAAIDPALSMHRSPCLRAGCPLQSVSVTDALCAPHRDFERRIGRAFVRYGQRLMEGIQPTRVINPYLRRNAGSHRIKCATNLAFVVR